MIRKATRDWVKKEISPKIESICQSAKFDPFIIKGLGDIGAFGSYIPTEYGGAGLDQISYGIIMMELERGDSGVRSCASVQSSLVMYPIFKYGSEEQKKKYLPSLALGSGSDVIVSQNLEQVQMLIPGKQKQYYLKMDLIIKFLVKKCGFLMLVLPLF
jgi:alkylation response protein AidB-like acyl-CoA dehydrogenase